MNIGIRKQASVTIVDLGGKLTAGDGAAVIGGRVKGLLDGGVRQFLINMAGLQMMDSSGLGELVMAEKTAKAVGAQIKLLNVGSNVKRVFELANLIGVFETFDDEIDAVNSFRR